MKHRIIKFILMICDLMGINYLFNKYNSDAIRILMYHGVSSKKLPSEYWTLLSLSKFIDQMKIIKRGYNVIKCSEIIPKSNNSLLLKDNAVVITFDDGYENVLNEAYPILQNHQFPAIIFVVTGLSNRNEIIWTDMVYNIAMLSKDDIVLSDNNLGTCYAKSDNKEKSDFIIKLKTYLKSCKEEKKNKIVNDLMERYPISKKQIYESFRLLSESQIKRLSETKLIQIASHSDYHSILSQLSDDQQKDDINQSLSKFDEWGIEIDKIFAYPNGRAEDYNNATINILKSNNIKAAVSTTEGLHYKTDDLYRIKRISIGADINIWEFKAKLSGLYYIIDLLL
ncbi:MAG: polysaccharide deacetylase family protein [candidate division Zixibacteria bacterium]|nr:polysaccharide deacetylase family protein [candidate division Zixibacteria bacterium]